MAIEMELVLVSRSALAHITSMPFDEVVEGMSLQKLREMRPDADDRLHRLFDIDAEAEFLDWVDSTSLSGASSTMRVIINAVENKEISVKTACEGLMCLMRWTSPGSWEAWEARGFLYLEPLLAEPVEDIQSLYEHETWDEVFAGLSKLTEKEYTEKVVFDWMNRRKELGETLDEKADARILPTMQAHQRLAAALHHTVGRANGEADLITILGREHLEFSKWGHGEWNLARIIHSGLP